VRPGRPAREGDECKREQQCDFAGLEQSDIKEVLDEFHWSASFSG
jgi:hypothetical protein